MIISLVNLELQPEPQTLRPSSSRPPSITALMSKKLSSNHSEKNKWSLELKNNWWKLFVSCFGKWKSLDYELITRLRTFGVPTGNTLAQWGNVQPKMALPTQPVPFHPRRLINMTSWLRFIFPHYPVWSVCVAPKGRKSSPPVECSIDGEFLLYRGWSHRLWHHEGRLIY